MSNEQPIVMNPSEVKRHEPRMVSIEQPTVKQPKPITMSNKQIRDIKEKIKLAKQTIDSINKILPQ